MSFFSCNTFLTFLDFSHAVDGGPCHFKQCHNFIALTQLSRKHQIPICWNFYASAHGKGPWDGAGAVLKKWLRSFELTPEGARLKSGKAAAVVEVAEEYLSNIKTKGSKLDGRRFVLVDEQEVNMWEGPRAKTIEGTHKLHSFLVLPNSEGLTDIYLRDISCTCPPCLTLQLEGCTRATVVSPWRRYTMIEVEDTRNKRNHDAKEGSDEEHDIIAFQTRPGVTRSVVKGDFVALKVRGENLHVVLI